jgi:transketolase
VVFTGVSPGFVDKTHLRQEALARVELIVIIIMVFTGVSHVFVCNPSSHCRWEIFEKQSQEYKDSILPRSMYNKTVSVEAACTFGWAKYAVDSVGHDDFGASAPAPILYKEFGITAENVAAKVQALL